MRHLRHEAQMKRDAENAKAVRHASAASSPYRGDAMTQHGASLLRWFR